MPGMWCSSWWMPMWRTPQTLSGPASCATTGGTMCGSRWCRPALPMATSTLETPQGTHASHKACACLGLHDRETPRNTPRYARFTQGTQCGKHPKVCVLHDRKTPGDTPRLYALHNQHSTTPQGMHALHTSRHCSARAPSLSLREAVP